MIRRQDCCSWLGMLVVLLGCLLLLPAPSSYHVTAFAAGSKRSNKNSKRQRQRPPKGFGAPPPTLDQIVAKFPTRQPADNTIPCPCGGTSKSYAACCQPLHHQHERTCQTPLDVLTSRYTAFCFRNISYIMETTHESCRDWREDRIAWAKDLNKHGMFDSYEFVQLRIMDQPEYDEESDLEASITFSVVMRDVDKNQQVAFVEESTFVRKDPSSPWLYASGVVRTNQAGLEDVVLNG